MLSELLGQSDEDAPFNGVVLSRGAEVLACRGISPDVQARAVAHLVNQGWQENRPQAQVQFLPAGEGYDVALLYTRPVIDDYLLTLIARPHIAIGELRARADVLAEHLTQRRAGLAPGGKAGVERPVAPTSRPPVAVAPANSLALAWRPINRLPAMFHDPLRRCLEELAAGNACVLTHVMIRPEFVHLVVTCPPERNSAWAAYLFKEGSEAELQARFELTTPLWAKGYYGAEATNPLSENELSLFLESGESE
jgi:hypothetical protein